MDDKLKALVLALAGAPGMEKYPGSVVELAEVLYYEENVRVARSF